MKARSFLSILEVSIIGLVRTNWLKHWRTGRKKQSAPFAPPLWAKKNSPYINRLIRSRPENVILSTSPLDSSTYEKMIASTRHRTGFIQTHSWWQISSEKYCKHWIVFWKILILFKTRPAGYNHSTSSLFEASEILSIWREYRPYVAAAFGHWTPFEWLWNLSKRSQKICIRKNWITAYIVQRYWEKSTKSWRKSGDRALNIHAKYSSLISVIVATLNCSQTLPKCLQSIIQPGWCRKRTHRHGWEKLCWRHQPNSKIFWKNLEKRQIRGYLPESIWINDRIKTGCSMNLNSGRFHTYKSLFPVRRTQTTYQFIQAIWIQTMKLSIITINLNNKAGLEKPFKV